MKSLETSDSERFYQVADLKKKTIDQLKLKMLGRSTKLEKLLDINMDAFRYSEKQIEVTKTQDKEPEKAWTENEIGNYDLANDLRNSISIALDELSYYNEDMDFSTVVNLINDMGEENYDKAIIRRVFLFSTDPAITLVEESISSL